MSYDAHTQSNGRNITRYNLLQGAALLKLFRQARGRAPLTDAEFREWIDGAQLPSPLDPYAILTPDEVRAIEEREE